MKRMVGGLGILGLVYAVALPTVANAAAVQQMKLFGTTYNVAIFGRDQTYKKADGKQVKIVLTDASTYTQKAALFFAEGADPTKDRLLVACHQDDYNDDTPWHQLYMLTGPGDDG